MELGGDFVTTFKSPIIRVRTIGSRATGDLRAHISSKLPSGFNWVVLRYAPDDSWVDGYLVGTNNPKVADITITKVDIQSLLADILMVGISGISYPTSGGIKFIASDGTFETG